MKPQFITDEKGNRTAVILSIPDFEKFMDELDNVDAVRLYDEAKAENLMFRPLEEALNDINRKRIATHVPGTAE